MKTFDNDKLEKKINREEALKQGFYDGRFRHRVVPDKKKKQNKERARREKIEN